MDPVSRAQNSDSSARRVIGRPFPKGVSGNPGGKPKKKPVSEIFEEIFDDPETRERIKQRVIKTMCDPGMAGVLMFREGGERTEGKVAQEMAVSGSLNISLAETIQQRRKQRGDSNK